MFRTPKSTTPISDVRLIGGVLAFLLLCGTTLLGGLHKPKTVATGFWYGGSKAPLIDVIGYPEDCQRAGRSAGEEADHLDPPCVLHAHPQVLLVSKKRNDAAHPTGAVAIAVLHHRPQAPRAPPLA